jgi:hypothetical protein
MGWPYLAVLLGLYVFKQGWAAVLFYHAGIVAAIWAGGRPGVIRAIGRGWSAPAAVMTGIVFSWGGLLVALLWDMISLDGLHLGTRLAGLGLSGNSWWAFMVYYVTIHPVLEELFWRHLLTGTGGHPAFIDATFAGYHVLVLVLFIKIPWVLLSFGVLWFASWAWRRLAEKYSGLGVTIASHALADLSIITGVQYLIRPQ